jgi:hypothetical protein
MNLSKKEFFSIIEKILLEKGIKIEDIDYGYCSDRWGHGEDPEIVVLEILQKTVDGKCMLCGDVADTEKGWICTDCRKL